MRVSLLTSLSRLVLDGSALALRRAVRVWARRLVFGISAYLAALGALGFLVSALHTAMAQLWGSVPASLILAGGLGVIALGLFLAASPRRVRRGGTLRRL